MSHRDDLAERLWDESDEEFPGRITREGCAWVTGVVFTWLAEHDGDTLLNMVYEGS